MKNKLSVFLLASVMVITFVGCDSSGIKDVDTQIEEIADGERFALIRGEKAEVSLKLSAGNYQGDYSFFGPAENAGLLAFQIDALIDVNSNYYERDSDYQIKINGVGYSAKARGGATGDSLYTGFESLTWGLARMNGFTGLINARSGPKYDSLSSFAKSGQMAEPLCSCVGCFMPGTAREGMKIWRQCGSSNPEGCNSNTCMIGPDVSTYCCN